MELYRHSGNELYIGEKGLDIGEMTLAILADSGLPKPFWWNAYVTACDVVRMMPTSTCLWWMSHAECLPGCQTPNLSRLLRWGCKACVLLPKADRCKDWEGNIMVG